MIGTVRYSASTYGFAASADGFACRHARFVLLPGQSFDAALGGAFKISGQRDRRGRQNTRPGGEIVGNLRRRQRTHLARAEISQKQLRRAAACGKFRHRRKDAVARAIQISVGRQRVGHRRRCGRGRRRW